jgi:hypothetical protein
MFLIIDAQTEDIRMSQRTVWMLALTAALIGEAAAQQYVYPAKGQSPEQQKSDEAACYTWAVQQSGFDPANPPPPQQAAQPQTGPSGVTPGAGVRGAARGAVVGEIAGGDNTGTAAAAGAVAARAKPPAEPRGDAAGPAAATSRHTAATAGLRQGTRCLPGRRGYTVK